MACFFVAAILPLDPLDVTAAPSMGWVVHIALQVHRAQILLTSHWLLRQPCSAKLAYGQTGLFFQPVFQANRMIKWLAMK